MMQSNSLWDSKPSLSFVLAYVFTFNSNISSIKTERDEWPVNDQVSNMWKAQQQ